MVTFHRFTSSSFVSFPLRSAVILHPSCCTHTPLAINALTVLPTGDTDHLRPVAIDGNGGKFRRTLKKPTKIYTEAQLRRAIAPSSNPLVHVGFAGGDDAADGQGRFGIATVELLAFDQFLAKSWLANGQVSLVDAGNIGAELRPTEDTL